jgi:uncharacterized protein Yka (UPF0111/DUF47 family)
VSEQDELLARLDEAAVRLRSDEDLADEADDPFRRALAELERATVEVRRARDRLAELEAALRAN